MKKYVLGIITGLIMAGIIGVSATILYQADEVGFTPANPNWNVTNIEEALNDLYNKSSDNQGTSSYNFTFSEKVSASKVVINIVSNENFNEYYCGIDNNYTIKAANDKCVIENLSENTDYTVSVIGIDKDIQTKKKTISVKTSSKLVMDYDYLASGSTNGNVVITSNNPDSTYGLSITGTSDLTNYNSATEADFIAHYRKWYKEVDLSNYNELSFYAKKSVNHGTIVIAIDNEKILNLNYTDLDTNWHKYNVDISNYTGNHILTIAGGYTDFTGSASSNTQYYDIELS